jgi:hypothetical protein
VASTAESEVCLTALPEELVFESVADTGLEWFDSDMDVSLPPTGVGSILSKEILVSGILLGGWNISTGCTVSRCGTSGGGDLSIGEWLALTSSEWSSLSLTNS